MRSAQEQRQLVEVAGGSLYILERTCLDSMINRSISTPIAVAETKEELVGFCQEIYGDDIPFDDNGRTPTVHIPMGKASFQIKTVAELKRLSQ